MMYWRILRSLMFLIFSNPANVLCSETCIRFVTLAELRICTSNGNSPVDKNNSAGYVRLTDYTLLLFTATCTMTLVQTSANMCIQIKPQSQPSSTIQQWTVNKTLWYTRRPAKKITSHILQHKHVIMHKADRTCQGLSSVMSIQKAMLPSSVA
jgi:hypothetical protein